ncbi:DUF3152 domain-containing protein [Dactylosporangium sp. NPDC051485]|uniref:DUF3152 domain-containing protein n=1 Tax=Dactylosporangium sp. NPDC051485 TaxID=3154846 RepID=UPI003412995E
MLGTRVGKVLLIGVLLTGLAGVAGCGKDGSPPADLGIGAPSSGDPFPVGQLEGDDSGLAPASHSPAPSASKKPSAKPSVKNVKPGGDTGGGKVNTNDGVPNLGSGTFSKADGETGVVGSTDAATLVKYQVEIENGIQWGNNPVWTTSSLAAEVDRAIAAPKGWTMSGDHPVTYNSGQTHINGASWKFQRVSDGNYNVVLRLATPGTVDKLCKSVGVTTQGIYSCRYGKTILLNLRRWLKGIDGFPAGIDFHGMTVLHEMGHFLGFDHMKCPGGGQVAPVMQTQTIALNGCTPNSYPFTSDGTFVQGPWASS